MPESDNRKVTIGRPPVDEKRYDWKRISEEAKVIDYCRTLGAVDLKPPRSTGFGGTRG